MAGVELKSPRHEHYWRPDSQTGRDQFGVGGYEGVRIVTFRDRREVEQPDVELEYFPFDQTGERETKMAEVSFILFGLCFTLN